VITVIVDFNARARHGLVKASPRHADGPVMVGDRVRALDPDEPDMAFQATVQSIEDGRMYLEVDWQPEASSELQQTFSLAPMVWISTLSSAASAGSFRGLPSSLTA
jgi:hypothetical protein